MRHLTFLLLAVLILAGCAKPIPPERSSYVGEWQSPTMALLITQDGRANYERMVGESASKSVSGPIQSFHGDNFVVGVGPIKTTFVVSVPPHEDQGTWRMTVDGVELTRR
jgi:hypothetical protein